MATAKLTKTALTINGEKASIYIAAGPWVPGVPAELIKIRSKRTFFPAAFKAHFSVENNSDMRDDYFEADCIRLMPGHPLYAAAKALAA